MPKRARSGAVSADEGEGVEINLYAPCRRTFVDHDVDAVVLHGRIEVFLHYGAEAVDFVDEEHVVRLERGEESCQVARFVEHRSAGKLESHTEFVGNDVRQCGLSQSGRAVQKGVVEGLAAHPCCFDEDFQVFHHLFLSCEVGEREWAQCIFEVPFRCGRLVLRAAYVEVVLHLVSCGLSWYVCGLLRRFGACGGRCGVRSGKGFLPAVQRYAKKRNPTNVRLRFV